MTGDVNAFSDIFIHNRLTGVTERVSVRDTELEGNSFSVAPSVSADGRLVAFQSNATNLVVSDGNGFSDIFVRHRLSGGTERVSIDSVGTEAAGSSYNPSIRAGLLTSAERACG